MNMVQMQEEKPDVVGRGERFWIGVGLFVLYVMLVFNNRFFFSIGWVLYFVFLAGILILSFAIKRFAVLVGFLVGTATGVTLAAGFLYFLVSHMGC